mmetsp:Transcript_23204/g.43242  ORF Transcript_23204/g.43242 Transcript_23204/m.43242 type:complete len:98 (-) Transcript_23204:884-1177(-)
MARLLISGAYKMNSRKKTTVHYLPVNYGIKPHYLIKETCYHLLPPDLVRLTLALRLRKLCSSDLSLVLGISSIGLNSFRFRFLLMVPDVAATGAGLS